MSASTSRSLVFSILLHGFVIAVALLLMLPANRERIIVPRTFEVFSGPAQPQSHAPLDPATPGPAVKFPAVPVPAVHPATPVEAETADEPAPRIHTPPVPVRRVPPSTPARISPRTTAEEFQRQHPSTTKPATTGSQTASPRSSRIDISKVLATAGDGPSSATAPAADENLSADYLARLMGKLRAAHEKPDGLDAGLHARVEFSIRADGSLADARIVESSGSREFDDSVLAAFRNVRDLGAPPHGASRGNRVTFRTSDGV